MKKIMTFVALVLCYSVSFGQDKTATILAVYQTQVIPYLDQQVKTEYGTPTDNETKAVMLSRISLLRMKVNIINESVQKECKERNVTETNLITAYVEQTYRNTFTGLPKEFFDKAEAAVKEKKL